MSTPQVEARPKGAVECWSCSGRGIYYGRGYVDLTSGKPVFVGFTGPCYRCGGKGWQTAKDTRRNRYYDNHVRKVYI